MRANFRTFVLALATTLVAWSLANAGQESTAAGSKEGGSKQSTAAAAGTEALTGRNCPSSTDGSAKMFKVVALLKRRSGMTVAEFRDYYENRHAPLAIGYMPKLCRYFRRFVNRQIDAVRGAPVAATYDVLSEFWFASRADYEETMRHLAKPEIEAIMAADEKQLFDDAKIILEVEEFETRIPGLRCNRVPAAPEGCLKVTPSSTKK